MRLILLCILFSPSAFAIVRGTEPAGDDPVRGVIVKLSLPDAAGRGENNCTGTVIGARWVITAKHCVEGVGQGSRIRRPNGEVASVSRLMAIPGNRQVDLKDFALLELATPVRPPYAHIATADEMPSKGQAVSIAGYGQTSEHARSDQKLRKTVLNVKSPRFQGTALALEGGGRGACYGDSGGPAYTVDANNRVTLVGVCSGNVDARIPCGEGPSVYAGVGAARTWIAQKTGLTSEPAAPPVVAAKPRPEPMIILPAEPPPPRKVAQASLPVVAAAATSESCLPELTCASLSASERAAKVAEFYRDGRAETSICLSGGIFSNYRGGVKRKGGCEIITKNETVKCPASEALCSPALFCAGDGAPRCLPFGGKQNYAVTIRCEQDFNARIKAGERECDPSAKDPVFREHWNETRTKMAAMFEAVCVKNEGSAALLCSQCAVVRRRLEAMNRRALKLTCAGGKLRRQTAAAGAADLTNTSR